MEFVDTHCHLQFENYNNREDEVLTEAARVGVTRLICVGTSLADSQKAAEIAKAKKAVWATVGSHPHDAAKFLAHPNAPKKLKKIAGLPKIIAVGETGLDYYKQYSSKNQQQQALKAHLEIGAELGLPFVFHIRDALPAGRQAWEDFWQIFDAHKGLKGVIHSFSTHSGYLEEILSRGLFVGLNGIMTFTKDAEQLAAAKAIPLDRLVLETDAPFLTPAPNRNELCEPKHIAVIAEFLAELRGEKLQDLAHATTANAIRLFGLER